MTSSLISSYHSGSIGIEKELSSGVNSLIKKQFLENFRSEEVPPAGLIDDVSTRVIKIQGF